MFVDRRIIESGQPSPTAPCYRARWHGFTLVELLVVIGIISTLIAILLPSLSRARQAANMLVCQSNLKQISSALMLYAQDNRGLGCWGNIDTPTGSWYELSWYMTLSPYLGGKEVTERGMVSRVMQDTDVDIHPGNAPGLWHYTAHPRVLPAAGHGDPFRNWAEFHLYPITSMRNASEKAIIWDGGINPAWGGCASNLAYFVNNNSIWWAADARSWADVPSAYLDTVVPLGQDDTLVNLSKDSPKWLGIANRDASGWNDYTVNAFRYRHLGDTRINMLFGDGHVESRALGEVLWRDVCVSIR